MLHVRDGALVTVTQADGCRVYLDIDLGGGSDLQVSLRGADLLRAVEAWVDESIRLGAKEEAHA